MYSNSLGSSWPGGLDISGVSLGDSWASRSLQAALIRARGQVQ